MNTLRLNIVTLMVLSMNVKTLRWLSYKQQLEMGMYGHIPTVAALKQVM